MKIIEKLAANNSDPIENPAPVIAFLGDSVTQWCFLSQNDYEAAYHNRVRQKLNYLFPRAVVNIINAGIGGTTAKLGAKRIERDVLSKNPDLCVVCFGLNDVGGVDAGLPIYKKSLETIFEKLQERGVDTTRLLVNGINHPRHEMHDLFANSLVEILFE